MTLLKKPLLKKAPSKKAPTQKRPRSNEASSTPRKRIKSESIEESTDVEDELDEADAGEDEDSNESENYALDDAERSDEETGDDEPADAPDTEFEDISADWEPPKNALAKTGSSDKALSTSDPLQAYMRDVQRHPLLTAEEEKSLALRYHQDGDVKAAARLVSSNVRLVVKLAYEYRRAYRNMMDLIQEGNIGLMQAVKRYDPHRGVKLSSYAAWWSRA